jgi:hypothetical protein
MAYAAFLGTFSAKKEYQKKVDFNFELVSKNKDSSFTLSFFLFILQQRLLIGFTQVLTHSY